VISFTPQPLYPPPPGESAPDTDCFKWGKGGGVQLGPFGTTATNRPIVPAPGDYDDGEIGGRIIGMGNRSTCRKPAPVSFGPPQTPHACPDANPGRRGGKPATNRLSYGTALPRYPLDRRLVGPQSRSGRCKEQKSYLSWDLNPGLRTHSP
jgi:hypothetical protein